MTPNYKVIYNAANGEKIERLFHSLIRAFDFAALVNGIVINIKEV